MQSPQGISSGDFEYHQVTNLLKLFRIMFFQNIGFRMSGVSRAVFAAQAVLLLGNAVYGIMYSVSVADYEGSLLKGTPKDVVQCMGLTSLALGTNYLISIYRRDPAITIFSVPSRPLAAWVMYQNGGIWTRVAAFEASMAIVAGAALIWDR
ncbi:hypothetical protein BDW72DRAFT_180375 [Aspergillus terricola var. indicus]